MIGISFVHPDKADQFRHPPWTELRCARIEPGSDDDHYYWRTWELPLEEKTRLMDEVVKDRKIDGFTLWWNDIKKNWQMNVRQKGEAWSVNHITQAEAEVIFATLEASHPDGPWSVKGVVQDDILAAEDVQKMRSSSAHARGEKEIEDVMDAAVGRGTVAPPDRPRPFRPTSVPSLGDALRSAREAVERCSAVLATLTGEV